MIGLCLAAMGFGIGFAWPHLGPRVFAFAADNEKDIAAASITIVLMTGFVLLLERLTGQRDLIVGLSDEPARAVAAFTLDPEAISTLKVEARYLRSGRLVQVLADHQTPPADIYAIYPQRHQTAARVRAFVDFLAERFATSSPGH